MTLRINQLRPGAFYQVIDAGESADPLFNGAIVLATRKKFFKCGAVTVFIRPDACRRPEDWIGAPWGEGEEDATAKFVEVPPPLFSFHSTLTLSSTEAA